MYNFFEKRGVIILTMRAARPTARSTLPRYKLRTSSFDVLFSRFCFLRRSHPANPLVAREWCDVFPSRMG